MTHAVVGRVAAATWVAIGALLLCSTSASAQTLDRAIPPVAPAAAPFKFPRTFSQTLPNGLRVIVVEEHDLPLVTVRAVVGVDSLYDPPGKEGLFALTNAMLREGTTTMSADRQASAVAGLGNAVTPVSFTTIPESVDGSMALMADMLRNPAFPQNALDRRKAGLTAIEQRRAELPASRANQLFLGNLLGPMDPAARSFLPSGSSVSSITRDDVQHFYDAYFHPSNTTIIVVGDVSEKNAIAQVRDHFGSWTGGHAPPPPQPAPFVARPTTIYLIDQPSAKQTQIVVGTVGPRRDSRDAAALDVMAAVLGTGSASRISQNLRERHSYMYSGLPLAITWRPEPALSLISGVVPVNPAKSDSALIEWLSELRGMRDNPPTDAEMTVARGLLVGILPGQIETVDRLADRLTFLVQNHLPLDYYDRYVGKIAAVTPREVSNVASRYLDPAHLVIVVAGDRATLEPMLRAANLGALVTVDP